MSPPPFSANAVTPRPPPYTQQTHPTVTAFCLFFCSLTRSSEGLRVVRLTPLRESRRIRRIRGTNLASTNFPLPLHLGPIPLSPCFGPFPAFLLLSPCPLPHEGSTHIWPIVRPATVGLPSGRDVVRLCSAVYLVPARLHCRRTPRADLVHLDLVHGVCARSVRRHPTVSAFRQR